MQSGRQVPWGEIHQLGRIRWSYFITVLLPHEQGIENRAERIWNGFRGRFAKQHGIDPRLLLWLVAFERGRSEANPHLHALIGGSQWAATPEKISSSCEKIARRMELRGVDVRLYEDRPNAIQYLFKERDAHRVRHASDDGRWPICSPNLSDTLRRGRM